MGKRYTEGDRESPCEVLPMKGDSSPAKHELSVSLSVKIFSPNASETFLNRLGFHFYQVPFHSQTHDEACHDLFPPPWRMREGLFYPERTQDGEFISRRYWILRETGWKKRGEGLQCIR